MQRIGGYLQRSSPIRTLRLLCYILTRRLSRDQPELFKWYNVGVARQGSRQPLPAAVELGRRGGKARVAQLSKEEIRDLGRRGGKARARRLSKERLREIARKAVNARWARARSKKQDHEQ